MINLISFRMRFYAPPGAKGIRSIVTVVKLNAYSSATGIKWFMTHHGTKWKQVRRFLFSGWSLGSHSVSWDGFERGLLHTMVEGQTIWICKSILPLSVGLPKLISVAIPSVPLFTTHYSTSRSAMEYFDYMHKVKDFIRCRVFKKFT